MTIRSEDIAAVMIGAAWIGTQIATAKLYRSVGYWSALNEVSKRAEIEIDASHDPDVLIAVFRTAYGEDLGA